MAIDADLLDSAAAALDGSAARLDEAHRHLIERFRNEILVGTLGWKGPAASQHWDELVARSGRISRARDNMRQVASQMRREAVRIRDEERRRLEAMRG